MDSTYRLIIIEDEDEIRGGLESIIDWASLGFRVSATFPSGEEALAWLENNTVDVVMTDIRLGGISGLDICRWVHKNRPSVKLVILSGYSDFGYAQQAIDTKVSKYLLKPVDIPELYSAYRLIHEEFEAGSRNRRLPHKAVQYGLRSLLYTLAGESAGTPGLPKPSRFLTEDDYDLEGGWDFFKVRCSTVYDRLEEDFNSLLTSETSFGAAGLLLDKTLLVTAVRKTEGHDTTSDNGDFHDRLERLIDGFSETSGISMTMLYCNRFPDYSELGNFVRDNFSLPQAPVSSIAMMDLIKAVNTYDFDVLESSLPDLDHDALKTLGYLLLSRQSLFTGLADRDITDTGEIQPARLAEEAIAGRSTDEELAESIRKLIRYFRKGMDSNASGIVDKARSYIHSCNGRKVSLNEVAENIFVSPAYLSKEFKRQLGINFKAYVSDASINCAKELLSGTSVRVHEISNQLGFKDVRYFYKYFSEATGLTPTEYRHQYRNDSGSTKD